MILLLLACFVKTNQAYTQENSRPNVIVIITDDQGYGDLGITGNRHLKTPVLDQFAKESIRFNNFYVSPVCAPTRSSLMTGRYSLRTGVRDTYNGGAIMAQNEITIAEMLKTANYKTGIFGKWHLGDNYPSRPMDQGFDESVIHLSGGMGQVGDITTHFRRDSSYFNPILWHNGKQEAYQGYCSDIFAQQAIKFIEANKDQPFFCYLSFNAPHTPLQVPDKYYQMYKDIDPAEGYSTEDGPFPNMSERNKEDARKVYGMVTNIDENIGHILNALDELKLKENTILIFMTDNGPQQPRYIAGMRGRKSSVYRGGVRVPFYLKHPGLEGNKDIETTAAHIDILPTIAELCQVDLPTARQIDGKSLLPILQNSNSAWQERYLFFYWTRRFPERFNNMALQKGDYKLVGHTNYDANFTDFELFNIDQDPYEQSNILSENEQMAKTFKNELESIYYELISSKNLVNPPLIEVGNEQENPIILNRNDADGERGVWSQEEVFGKWNVKINEGHYNLKFKFIKPVKAGGILLLETNGIINRKTNQLEETDMLKMNNVYLPDMEGELIPTYLVDRKKIFPFWVELERISN